MTFEELDRKNIWHPFEPLQGPRYPIFIKSADGIYLETQDGRRIIDAVSSWWVNVHGHSNLYIAEAIAAQAKKLEHVIFAGFTHEPAITLSKNLLSILPSNQEKLFFSDNGSTAVEVALKMAFQYWHNQGIKKKKIVAIDGAYHGDTFGSMSVGERGIFTKPFHDYLFDTLFLDFPSNDDERVVEQFLGFLKDREVGTFIFEPLVQGAAGMRIYRAEILDKLISIAQNNNVICIADEVFTGFGRTGKLFASNHLVTKPDIIALSKGLTGGALPLGVTSCSKKITGAFQTDDFSKTFFHGHSYTGNPLSCAAANASFELLIKPECVENIKRISSLQAMFAKAIAGHPQAINSKSLGTILAIEIKSSGATTYDNAIRSKIYPFFLERNILLRPLGNVIYVVPPYIIKPEELAVIHQAIEEFLNSLK